ncbi:glycosyltransferase family 4 protein [Thalassospira xiamenensis]|uniref:glycosyltransferase family 4 protein n=1 Tax=Thalassospira xiamenensis TaxID=220697 RepID=UPI003AA8FDD7
MKIYFDGQIFIEQTSGGISRYFCNLAHSLSNIPNVSARIIAPLHRNEHLADYSFHLCAGVRSPSNWRTGRISWGALRAVSPPISYLCQPDIVHETYFSPKSYLVNAKKRVTTIYDMIHELYFPGCETARNKIETLKRCDHVFCISENTQRDLCQILDFPIEKTTVTHLSYQNFSQYIETKNNSFLKDKPYFLYVGNRGGYKNFSALLEAYSVSPYLRNNSKIVAFGGGEFSEDESSQIKSLGLNRDQIVPANGPDSMLGIAYAGALAFIYPSQYEGFGIPPLEAMSANCPVICSNSSSLPEVVGDAALLFDPLNIDDLRYRMEEIAGSTEVRNKLNALAKDRLKLFSWEECAKKTLNAYESILQF